MALLDWSKSIRVATAIAFFVLAGIFRGPITCRDGWHSPSIGSREACSYHGGVARGASSLWFLLSVGIGFAAWFAADANSPRRRREEEEERIRRETARAKLEERRRELNELQAQQMLQAEGMAETPQKTVTGKRCYKCEMQ
ncbi:hypothetical protein ACVI1L_004446 [Bradyrhizobium sp. USDA 4516]